MKRVRNILWIMAVTLLLCACQGNTGETTVTSDDQNTKQEEKIEITLEALQEVTVPAYEDVSDVAGHFQKYCAGMMVQIQAGNLGGSGVIYECDDDYLWIATAAHVLENMEGTAKLIFDDGFEVTTDEVVRAKEQDLAFLKISRTALAEKTADGNWVDHGVNYHRAKISKEAYDSMQKGDLIIAMGSRSGVGQDAYAGVILEDYVFLEDFGVYMFIADVGVTPGMSGGAILDTKGNLMGIICGVSETREVAAAPVIALMAMDR